MLIANPIYDSVFKYMLDDNKVAKLLLSAIIGEDIIKLTLRPTEIKTHVKDTLTVYHIDFVAKIRSADNSERLVIIEIQKAKLATDIMRFRKYLGEQYANPNNIYEINEAKIPYGKALPILSIYFLGKKLEYTKAPVIKILREYLDLTNGKTIQKKEQFIESLTHDSYIIQIPFLKQNRKTELLQILSIFDQSNRGENYHILNISNEVFPEKYQSIIRRLQMANCDADIRTEMGVEDIYLRDMQNTERYVEEMKVTIEQNTKVIEEKDKTIEEKDKLIEEKDKILEENAKALEEKEKIIQEFMKKIKK